MATATYTGITDASGNANIYRKVSGTETALILGLTGYGVDFKAWGLAAADYIQWDNSASALLVAGQSRIDFSSATVNASNTDGGIIKAGTSVARVTEDTADMKFMSFYLDNGATSGDNRGMYLRLYLTGDGGGGESLRAFTTCENVASGTAHGAHISLNFGATGSITGLGIGVRATLHVPDQIQSGGTYAAGQSEIYFDGTTAAISGATAASIHRFACDGASGYTNDAPYVFEFVGLNSTQFETTYSDTPDRALKVLINGVAHWIACSTATT